MTPLLSVDVRSPSTRMLLSSDGSTTVLLEALLVTSLVVQVTGEEPITGRQLDPALRTMLQAEGGDPWMVRHSRLLMPDGRTVSVNRVVHPRRHNGWRSGSDNDVPLGMQLRTNSVLQRRELRDSGIIPWPDDDRRLCVFKEYLIHTEHDPSMLVHETFSPVFVDPY